MSEIESLLAVRVVVPEADEFEPTVAFYRGLLGREPFMRFGEPGDVQMAAFFRLGEVQLIVTHEQGATPEARIDQGPAWLCFQTADPEAALAACRGRGAPLPNEVVDTSFGTRGFFANDPMGLAVYVGTPWGAGPPA